MNSPAAPPASFFASRWIQLLLGLVCMMAISSPQYVWTLFTKPLTVQLGVPLSQLQITFSIFIVLQTFLSPLQGFLIEKFGPKLLLGAGAILTGLSWVLASSATSLLSLYLTYGVLGGIGTGVIYVGIVGLMVAWFPDRRGLAAGVGRSRLWDGGGTHHFRRERPHGQTWLSGHLAAFRCNFRRHRLCRGLGPETPAAGLDGRYD